MGLKGSRILVVEDAPDIREVFTLLLRAEGAQVEAAANGREALEFGARADFDIVLSGDALPAAEPLIVALRTPAVQSSIGALGGYDLSRAGSVEMLA